jgi:hypothetical protein
MTYCTGCGHQIHETAPTCPHCGAVQQLAKATLQAAEQSQGTLWLPVPALICGLLPVLSMLSPSDWTEDEAMGSAIFAITALVLAGIGLARQQRGRGMSIAALILGVIGLLGALESLA